MADANDQLALIQQSAVTVLPERELLARLATGVPLRVKAGFDPTAPDLHLGHVVLLEKLRQIQVLGHKIVLIIGDFTARIGDPTGRNVTRPPLSAAEVARNAATYTSQVFRILDPAGTEVRFNSEWLGPLSAADLIGLAGKYNLARMLERDDFARRYRDGQPIALHEFLYPLLQGYDSVAVRADLELGGTDQTFNLLVGRQLQLAHGLPAQAILTVPILEGLDGVKKMSKSLGNSVAIADPQDEMFGKIMSVSDELMWRYFELLSRRRTSDLQAARASVAAGANPRDLKLDLAQEIVGRFHGDDAASAARSEFLERFSGRKLPDQLPEIVVSAADPIAGVLIGNLLRSAGLAQSTSEGMRLVSQGAVRLNGALLTDPRAVVAAGYVYVVEVGRRRAARVTVEGSRPDMLQGG